MDFANTIVLHAIESDKLTFLMPIVRTPISADST